jgi:hypothetical protein
MGDIFRSRTTAVLVSSAMNQRLHSNSSSDIEGSYTFGRINLVSRDTQEIHPSSPTFTSTFQSDWAQSVCKRTPRRLQIWAISRIGMSVPISLFECIMATRRVLAILIDAAVMIHGQDGHLRSQPSKKRDGLQRGWMLNGCRDDVGGIQATRAVQAGALDGQVTGFRAATSEYDLLGLHSDQFGQRAFSTASCALWP